MLTLEQAIASYEKSAERYHKSFLHCKAHGGEFYQEEAKSNKICYEHDRQLAEWLRELQERRKQPEIIRCKDCAHYHTDVFGGELGGSGIWKNIIVAHNACDRWTKDMNCVTPDGFCFLAERRTDE